MWKINKRSVFAASVLYVCLLISPVSPGQQVTIDFEEVENDDIINNRYVDQGLDIIMTYDHGFLEEYVTGPWVEYHPQMGKVLCPADVFFHQLCGWPMKLKFVEPGDPSSAMLSDNVRFELKGAKQRGAIGVSWLDENENIIGTETNQNSAWSDSCELLCSESDCPEANENFTAPYPVAGIWIYPRSSSDVADCDKSNIYYVDDIEFEPYDPTKQERQDKDCAAEGAGFGNPCDASSGNKYQRETDIHNTPLPLTRYYSSQSARDVGLGVGWTTAYHKNLSIDGSAIRVYKGTGSSEGFLKRDDTWQGGVDGDLSLSEDASGYTVTRANGNTEKYDLSGKINSEQQRGQIKTYQYDAQGRLLNVTGHFGHVLRFQYAADGHIQTISNSSQSFQYHYDAADNLSEVSYPDSNTRSYHYENIDFPHALTGITDERGIRIAIYSYDVNGKTINTQHAQTENGAPQESFSLSYDNETQTTVVFPNGSTSVLTFDRNRGSNNLLESVKQNDGKSISQSFDSKNNLLSRTNEEEQTTKYSYNANNQRLSKTEAFGTPEALKTTYSYLSSSVDLPDLVRTPSVYPGAFYEKTISYDAKLNIDIITESGFEPDGTAITRATDLDYNNLGQLLRIDGPRIDVDDSLQLEYHQCTSGGMCGQLARVSNASGHTIFYEAYDANGRIIREVDENGLITEHAYNPRGWITTLTLTSPAGSARTTTYEYTENGELRRTISPAGLILNYQYDAASYLQRITDNLGNSIQYSYDLSGNRVRESAHDPAGTLTYALETQYDIRNRTASILSLGNTTQYNYDTAGNLDEVNDAKNQLTDYRVDSLNRVVEILDALSGLTQFQYNVQNRLIEVDAPNGAVTTYQHDDFGNLLIENSPDRGTTTSRYDTAGNLIQRTHANAEQVDYRYDTNNRLLQVTYASDVGKNISYAYDNSSPGVYGVGRLTQVTEQSGSLHYTYDAFGNISSDERTIDGYTYITRYAYDQDNNLREIIYPSGRVVNYLRDTIGRIAGVTTNRDASSTAITLVDNIGYLPFGPMNSIHYANGLNGVIDYDQAYRVSSIDTASFDAIAQNLSYSYDPVDNIAQITDTLDDQYSQLFSYDALSRLDEATGPYGHNNFDYDANGNRILRAEDSQNITYNYAAGSNRLIDLTDDEAWRYTYDENGNITSRTRTDGSGWIYAYSARNRLEAVSTRVMVSPAKGKKAPKARDTQIVSYAYNALGQRIGKTTASRTTTYLYGLNGELLTETDTEGNRAEYVYLEGQPMAVYKTVVASGEPPADEEIIIDNGQAETYSIGNWDSFKAKKDYGTDYQRANGGTGSLYRWTPSLSGGEYQVYAWWAHSRKYSNQVNYIVNHNGTQSSIVADHTHNGNQWNLLGRFNFSGEGDEYLQVSDDNGKTVADAVKFVKVLVPPPPQTTEANYFIHTDHLGTPQSLTDDSGQTVWNVRQSPFGISIPDEDVDGDEVRVEMNLRFPGQYFDAETGLHYNWNRYYDPETGRYITSDPIGLDGGRNTYAYVGGNPLKYIDANGLTFPGAYPLQNPFNPDQYEDNGNLNGGFEEQDLVCTEPAGSLNGTCSEKCCVTHDKCYEKYRCNASSWMGNLTGAVSAACQRCNTEARRCIQKNYFKDDCGCGE